MVKELFCCVLIFCSIQVLAQKKFSTDNGQVDFLSKADLELIRASSKKLQGVIDPTNNQFAFSVPVQSFIGFNSELQREHFNEKYLESERYPRMSFTGKIIENVDYFIDGTYEVRAKGELEIHGQKQTRIIKSKIVIEEGILNVETTFKVPLADHNISVPRIVNQKIATEIDVTVKGALRIP